MAILSLILGILSLFFMIPGLIPCLGWLNYFNLPFSGLGLLIALYLYTRSEENAKDSTVKIALYLNVASFVIGVIRLVLGAGFF